MTFDQKMGASDDDWLDCFVLMQDGLILPAEPYRLLLRLEADGYRMGIEEPDVLIVQPAARLTDDDCRLIRKWKPHLMLLIRYSQAADRAADLWTTPPGAPVH
jgi:hypothetical protein